MKRLIFIMIVLSFVGCSKNVDQQNNPPPAAAPAVVPQTTTGVKPGYVAKPNLGLNQQQNSSQNGVCQPGGNCNSDSVCGQPDLTKYVDMVTKSKEDLYRGAVTAGFDPAEFYTDFTEDRRELDRISRCSVLHANLPIEFVPGNIEVYFKLDENQVVQLSQTMPKDKPWCKIRISDNGSKCQRYILPGQAFWVEKALSKRGAGYLKFELWKENGKWVANNPTPGLPSAKDIGLLDEQVIGPSDMVEVECKKDKCQGCQPEGTGFDVENSTPLVREVAYNFGQFTLKTDKDGQALINYDSQDFEYIVNDDDQTRSGKPMYLKLRIRDTEDCRK